MSYNILKVPLGNPALAEIDVNADRCILYSPGRHQIDFHINSIYAPELNILQDMVLTINYPVKKIWARQHVGGMPSSDIYILTNLDKDEVWNPDKLRQAIASIGTGLSGLATDVGIINLNVATTMGNVVTINGNLALVTGRVATIESDVGTIKTDTALIKTKLTDTYNIINNIHFSLGADSAYLRAELTNTPLNANITYTGTSFNAEKAKLSYVNFIGISDQASAANGVKVQQSFDGTNWDYESLYSALAATSLALSIRLIGKYVRIIWINGAVNQTYFRLGRSFTIA